jgi:hypothetical protein
LVENIRTEKSCAALVPTLDGGKCASHRLLRVCMWYQHYGKSPLMMAIDEGMAAVATLMVEKGANLDFKSMVSDQQSLKTWLRADLATGRRPGSFWERQRA